jgi:hypothetical protein
MGSEFQQVFGFFDAGGPTDPDTNPLIPGGRAAKLADYRPDDMTNPDNNDLIPTDDR